MNKDLLDFWWESIPAKEEKDMAVGDWCGSLANLKVKVKVIFLKKKAKK